MRAHIRNNLKGILLMLLCALALTMGQFIWKLQTDSLRFVFIALGLFVYAVGALVMITAYRYGSVSVLQPVNSAGYVYALILGAIFFDERITLMKAAGVMLIILGVIFLAGGDKE